jgi:hypothetical protein
MKNYRKTSHSVYDLKYYLLMITKYRKPVFVNVKDVIFGAKGDGITDDTPQGCGGRLLGRLDCQSPNLRHSLPIGGRCLSSERFWGRMDLHENPDKTSCQGFYANQTRLKMGVVAYNLLHMIRQFYVCGEEVKRSMDCLIKRLIKVGARVSYCARRRNLFEIKPGMEDSKTIFKLRRSGLTHNLG